MEQVINQSRRQVSLSKKFNKKFNFKTVRELVGK